MSLTFKKKKKQKKNKMTTVFLSENGQDKHIANVIVCDRHVTVMRNPTCSIQGGFHL